MRHSRRLSRCWQSAGKPTWLSCPSSVIPATTSRTWTRPWELPSQSRTAGSSVFSARIAANTVFTWCPGSMSGRENRSTTRRCWSDRRLPGPVPKAPPVQEREAILSAGKPRVAGVLMRRSEDRHPGLFRLDLPGNVARAGAFRGLISSVIPRTSSCPDCAESGARSRADEPHVCRDSEPRRYRKGPYLYRHVGDRGPGGRSPGARTGTGMPRRYRHRRSAASARQVDHLVKPSAR